MGSMAARVGAFIAPYIIELGPIWVTYLMYAGIGCLAGLLALFLEETSRKPIKNIITK